MFTLISLIGGLALGAFSLARAKTFVLIVFGILPLIAYFSHHFVDFDPNYSMDSRKSLLDNITGLFMEIPEEFRLAVIVFFPAMIAGRIAITVYEAKRRDSIMSQDSLNRKRKNILKSHGMDSWHS